MTDTIKNDKTTPELSNKHNWVWITSGITWAKTTNKIPNTNTSAIHPAYTTQGCKVPGPCPSDSGHKAADTLDR